MRVRIKKYLSLPLWILGVIFIGSTIGYFTKPQINVWYDSLNLSPLTPPKYVFPVMWTILYAMIGTAGWCIWRSPSFAKLAWIKKLYSAQLGLNWTWTPLFFGYHLTGWAFLSIVMMIFTTAAIIYLGYKKIKLSSMLMIPYLCWIVFAGYLNFYVWRFN